VSAWGRGLAPLTVPVWYSYSPGGEIAFITPRDSRKARLIRRAGMASLCVQAAEPPYRYVSVEGPVSSIQEHVTVDERRQMARRYLGPQGGDKYVDATLAETERMIIVRVSPQRLLSHDETG
jgi:PPOX class probable F420-dependent enzyme